MIVYEGLNGEQVIFAEEFTVPEVEATILATATLRSRQGLQEHFKAEHDKETRAMASATEAQLAMTWGDHYVVRHPMPFGLTLEVFGRVMTQEEVDQQADDARVIRAGRENGWLYSWCYSTVEPLGEVGAWHLGRVEPITEQDFEAARAAGWLTPEPDGS